MPNGRAREGEERGRGVPLDDAQRIARHLNIPIEEACELLRTYSVEELVPARGYGLTHAAPAPLTGASLDELNSALISMEDSLNIGDKARLELATYGLPDQDQLDAIWDGLLASGLHISRPIAKMIDGVPLTSMVIRKGSPQWAAALIPLLVPIGTLGLIAFGIIKLEDISKALLPLILAAGGLTIIALGIMRQPAARAAEMAAVKYLK